MKGVKTNHPARKGILDLLLAGFFKMKFISAIFPVVALLVGNQLGFAQGFVNLDFEDATIAPTPVGGATYPADPAQCFPGWTIGNAYGSYLAVSYNDLSLGSPAISLMGPDFPNFAGYAPLEGSYSVLLQYFGLAAGPPTLSQTGLVPNDAQSISLLVPPGENSVYPAYMVVTLNGINIPLVPIADGRVAGNVSAFAGSVSQLTLSTVNVNPNSSVWLYFDDIQFSSSSVPEPSQLALTALGAVLLGFRRRRNLMR